MLPESLILIKTHTKFWSPTIPVSDSVSKLRLRKFQSRTGSRNWDFENSSLRLGLELRLLKFLSRTRSQKSKLGLADPWWSLTKVLPYSAIHVFIHFLNNFRIYSLQMQRFFNILIVKNRKFWKEKGTILRQGEKKRINLWKTGLWSASRPVNWNSSKKGL